MAVRKSTKALKVSKCEVKAIQQATMVISTILSRANGCIEIEAIKPSDDVCASIDKRLSSA